MFYNVYDKDLLLSRQDIADYIPYLESLEVKDLVKIRRHLWKDKSTRRYIGDKPLFNKEEIIQNIIDTVPEMLINKRDRYL